MEYMIHKEMTIHHKNKTHITYKTTRMVTKNYFSPSGNPPSHPRHAAALRPPWQILSPPLYTLPGKV
jgi:hypothetical protein